MYQNYNYYPQQQPVYSANIYGQQQQMRSISLKGHPVASLEEARATSIDFDGSVFYFPDLANKRIYTKQINVDGTASLNMYELKEIPIDQNFSGNSYVTREEFERAINEIKNAAISSPSTATTVNQF